jgi:hypothetical protein
MKLTKKADLSLTTVVIAAVALIVLVVLILIFSGRIAIFTTGVDSCPPGSNPQSDGCGTDIPTKIIRGEGGALTYCCPDDTSTSDNS